MGIPIEVPYNKSEDGLAFDLARIKVDSGVVTITLHQSGVIRLERRAWDRLVDLVNTRFGEVG